MTTYTATYSPEDNKLRLYASARLDQETYDRLKALGFKWAPKQELFVAPKWTPQREDALTELAGEIEAEEMTLAERAAIKAERLEGLATKRHAQANAFARRADELSEAFYMGQPILIGHHSERKARKTQERMHAAQDRAGKAHKAANYWLYRAEGVERFANMKNCDRTRANRIKELLAELRDLQRGINAAHKAISLWDSITTDEQISHALGAMESRALFSTWDNYRNVRDGKQSPADARAECIARANAAINGPNRRRWIEHTLNRLAYERSMQGDVPRFDGAITPVILQAFAREHGAESPKATATDPGYFQLESPVPLPLHLASGSYLELSTDEWRDMMQECGYVVPDPKPRRESKREGAAVPLLNLTNDQAEQLQRIWNARANLTTIGGRFMKFKPRDVCRVTQATYSANSKGDYSPLATIEIDADGARVVQRWERMELVRSGEPVARIRIKRTGGELYGPDAVCVVTDKPSKALPIDLDAIEATLTARAQELAA